MRQHCLCRPFVRPEAFLALYLLSICPIFGGVVPSSLQVRSVRAASGLKTQEENTPFAPIVGIRNECKKMFFPLLDSDYLALNLALLSLLYLLLHLQI